jgi:exoribonuclease-2
VGVVGDTPQLAIVQGIRGGRLDLKIGFQGRNNHLPLREVYPIQQLAGRDPGSLRLDQSPWHLSAEALAAALPPSRDLATAWLLMTQPDTAASGKPDAADGAKPPPGLDLGDFVDLFGDAADATQRAATWLWLEGDQTLFRLRHGRIEPRSLQDLRQLRRERHLRQLGENQRLAWQCRLMARQPLANESLSAAQQADLDRLRQWAAGECSQPLTESLLRALQACRCRAESGDIRHLLVDLGQWPRHHLPALEATTWQLGFSPELLAEADRLVAAAAGPMPSDVGRLDLTHQRLLTIDDEDTQDIDDGLAIEWREGHPPRLWVHIADPGRLVQAGSPLDLEARRRASSLYLARGSLPMFPPQLAHGPMGLRQDHGPKDHGPEDQGPKDHAPEDQGPKDQGPETQRSAAWSLWVDLDQTGAVVAEGLERSWVKTALRLSYGDADELIDLAPPQERDLLCMKTLLERRRHWREQRGALNLEDPEGRIRCRGDEALLEISEPSPSRQMVAEAMILAGALMAERGQRLGIALPYRTQIPGELPTDSQLESLPPGPVRHSAIKRGLSRGQLGVTPGPHFSLALDAYVQATSPIRRYGDLLTQRQFEALRHGTDPMDEASLASLLSELETPLRQVQQISREDQRHWQQVWFEQHPQGQWPCLFLRWLRQDQRLGLVWAEDLAMTLAAECPPRSQPADALLLRIQQVDSLRDVLKLQAVA